MSTPSDIARYACTDTWHGAEMHEREDGAHVLYADHLAARAADAAIISRLPHTADGVPVICDGMVVYCPKGHVNKLTHATGRVYCTDGDCWSDGCQGDSGSGTYYSFDQCCASVRGEQP